MNILIIGSGGREHTFAWKVKQSKGCTGLFVAPGNSGTDAIATNLNIAVTDFDEIKNASLKKITQFPSVNKKDHLCLNNDNNFREALIYLPPNQLKYML